jgi:hypothetical protein
MADIKLVLVRSKLPKETLGTYYIMDGYKEIFKCNCLELPWLDNQKNISCIPDGIYPVIKYSSISHPDCFLIQNVPNRSGILIHLGTFATQKAINTAGCQLAGLNFVDVDGNGQLDIVGSIIAMMILNHFLPNNFNLIIC